MERKNLEMPMSGLSGVGYGGFNPAAIQLFQQNLFSQIDLNGDGSVSKSELEQAVSHAGGSTQAADALYSVLDPNNSGGFSEQQLAQVLPGAAFSDQMQAQIISFQAQGWPGAPQPGADPAQTLFSQIDSNGDGSISKAELEQAVTAVGGTQQAADALYAKFDPNGTGSVSEQQFIDALQPPSASGNTAQDALLALINQATQSNGATAAAGGTSTGTGTSAQDALLALIKASGASSSSSPAAQSAAGLFSQADLAHAFALYQNQLEQQLVSSIGSIQV
jgi:Ca2+-binding EF-hand superfamily protein